MYVNYNYEIHLGEKLTDPKHFGNAAVKKYACLLMVI
jgi:hypothetical protein